MSLDVNRMQRLVDAALDNAVAGGHPIAVSYIEEARDLVSYDADVAALAALKRFSIVDVAICVADWKRRSNS